VGLAQLDRLDGFVADRRRNFARLWQALAPLQDVLILPEATPNSDPSWFGFPITVRPGAAISRDGLVAGLNAARIATRNLFGGNLTRQPYMAGRDYRVAGDLSASDQVMNDTFWVGVYPGLGDGHIDYMAEQIAGLCRT
jgi:CDP-6-deoxy-D-xylo-4-hexulose-3-dehydrase